MPEKETRMLAVALTPAELLTAGQWLAEVTRAVSDEEKRAIEVKNSLKHEMAMLETRRSSLATLISRGTELREVEIRKQFDDAGHVEVIRCDTGKVIEVRAPTDDERQTKLL